MNTARLREALDYIKAHPEQLDQSRWVSSSAVMRCMYNTEPERGCFTAQCLAGWLVELEMQKTGAYHEMRMTQSPYEYPLVTAMKAIRPYAQKLLDVPGYTADYLFDAARTVAEMEAFLVRREREALGVPA